MKRRDLNMDFLAMAGVVAAAHYFDDLKSEELKAKITKVVVDDFKAHRRLNDEGVKFIANFYTPIVHIFKAKDIKDAVNFHSEIDEISKATICAVVSSLRPESVANIIQITIGVLGGRVNMAVLEMMTAGTTIKSRGILNKTTLEQWNMYIDYKPAANEEELATLKATATEEDILILEDMLQE